MMNGCVHRSNHRFVAHHDHDLSSQEATEILSPSPSHHPSKYLMKLLGATSRPLARDRIITVQPCKISGFVLADSHLSTSTYTFHKAARFLFLIKSRSWRRSQGVFSEKCNNSSCFQAPTTDEQATIATPITAEHTWSPPSSSYRLSYRHKFQLVRDPCKKTRKRECLRQTRTAQVVEKLGA